MIALCQLADWLAGPENWNRPAREVTELVVAIDAEVLISGGEQILRRERTFARVWRR